MFKLTCLHALAVSQNNKVKAHTDHGELCVVERIRGVDGQPRYISYPWYDMGSEGTIYENKRLLDIGLKPEGLSIDRYQWLPIEVAEEEEV